MRTDNPATWGGDAEDELAQASLDATDPQARQGRVNSTDPPSFLISRAPLTGDLGPLMPGTWEAPICARKRTCFRDDSDMPEPLASSG